MPSRPVEPKYRGKPITREMIEEWLEQYDDFSTIAEAIADDCKTSYHKKASVKTVRLWLSSIHRYGHAGNGVKVSDHTLLEAVKYFNNDLEAVSRHLRMPVIYITGQLRRIRLVSTSEQPTVFESPSEKENRPAELLRNAGVDIDSIGRVKDVTLGMWGGGIKNRDGEWEEHGLHSTRVRLVSDTPKFPLIQPAEPTSFTFESAPRILRKVQYKIILSDAQIGYLRDVETQQLEPSHDPRAMEVARQIVQDLQPTTLIDIGDFMDWPIFSRWQKRPEFFGVTQPSIQAGYTWRGRFIVAAGKKCEHITIGSNHLVRPETFILEYNREAVGLTRAVSPNDKGAKEWPVFSEAFLLRYDELGVKFSGHYPGGEHYIFDDLLALHAPPKKLEFAASYIHGHLHKLEMSTTAQHDRNGRRNFFGYDTGCLCQVGATTNKRRLTILRVPSDRARSDWAQGISVIEYIEGSQPKHQVYLVKIDDGFAMFGGQSYSVPHNFEEGILTRGVE